MSQVKQSRKPLSAISPNRTIKKKSTRARVCKPKLPQSGSAPTSQPAYLPLGPRQEHIGQPLLPCGDEGRKMDVLQIFELFWDDEVIDVVVEGTNRYAEVKGAGKRSAEGGAFGRPWKKVTGREIKVFLAILMYMGAKRGSGLGPGSFWNRRENSRSIIRALSFKRFSQIKRYLHISDPQLQLSRSEWFEKLEPLNSMIQSRCQQYYLPASNVTVDEMMIRFGGRSHHTYRMPSKPITEGYKVFALCDIGYTYSWIFASRLNSFIGLILQEDLTPTGSMVFQLASSLPATSELHFNLYMDNYFPSHQLFTKLRERGIGACGTARVNSGAFPPELHDDRKSIPWNEISGGPVGHKGMVLGIQWQDNRAVHFLTTIHTLHERVITERKKPRLSSSNGPAIRRVFGPIERAKVPIPVITNDYNRYKVGVDVADQYRSYYFTQLKCLRNWPPIFYWLLDTTIINTFLLASRLPAQNRYTGSSRALRLTLAELLVSQYGYKTPPPRKAYYTPKTTLPRYSKLQHRVLLSPPTGTKADHQFFRRGNSKLECAECRFTLRRAKKKGTRGTLTRFGCSGPGCGFPLCLRCYDSRHESLV